ncbi:hypothetical protein QL285_031995 [Trifolium repens]|nr:hypothetical protein QL285_031995 [Trifolium repens]
MSCMNCEDFGQHYFWSYIRVKIYLIEVFGDFALLLQNLIRSFCIGRTEDSRRMEYYFHLLVGPNMTTFG